MISQTDTPEDASQLPFSVYVIEIMPKWHREVAPNLPSGRRCFYVGQTGRSVKERFREHLTGETKAGRRPKRPARVFAKLQRANSGERLRNREDISLRRTIMARYEPQPDVPSAEKLEEQVVDDLRREGHCVYPKGLGTVPFDDFQRR